MYSNSRAFEGDSAVGGGFQDAIAIAVPGTEGFYSIGVSIALDSRDRVHIAFLRSPDDDPGHADGEGRIYYTNNSG